MGKQVKRLALGLLLVTAAFLAVPLSASAAEFETFVGCDDLSENPVPSHVCQAGDFPGAYFESDLDIEYDVCVEFPGGTFICAEEQLAEAGVLYVNSITTDLEGEHFVSWFVEGAEVGNWAFRMDPPPPPAIVTSPPPPAAPAVVPLPSVKCLKAKQAVNRLKIRLQKATGHKQKAKIRVRLKRARATARAAC